MTSEIMTEDEAAEFYIRHPGSSQKRSLRALCEEQHARTLESIRCTPVMPLAAIIYREWQARDSKGQTPRQGWAADAAEAVLRAVRDALAPAPARGPASSDDGEEE